jgi:uncharacterized membrane protein YoaT (DUF817 family)
MGKGAGGNHPPHFEKLRVAKLIYLPFFSHSFEEKHLFLLYYGNIYCPVS